MEQVRLIEGESNDKIYIALSHRWNSNTALQSTTGANVGRRKEEIDLNSLSQTFQDAVTATRKLGIQYLWIDSLCIVQDNNNEVTMECNRMELIFSQAYSVIAATSGHSGHYGFLSRHGMDGRPFLLPNDEENLHTRGWVFQERALARHTIHFATSQTYWECEGSIIGESGRDDFV
ncbi:HET-domain-containing protein [Mytilinidion resinicola]|uniref:HET-domain-containing protein n=1 Tax=Mytilinidion resinicola TaxID=574789 RepID=A0A6A6YP48_9PEZI|nr:HET-domain-containing protein [Mytilinidion resinicola]KAF2810666.1 HET-domain-containing protein [Mytilinidion resinicola]